MSGRLSQASRRGGQGARRPRRARARRHGAAQGGDRVGRPLPVPRGALGLVLGQPRQEGLLLLRLRRRAATSSTSCGERHALDFVGAIEWLAERFGVSSSTRRRVPRSWRAGAGRTVGASCWRRPRAFYHRVLRESPLAEGARAYLTERGVTCARWPSASSSGSRPTSEQVIKGARTKGFADRELEEAGITRRGRDRARGSHGRGRLIFTLFDSRGRPVAFAGRRLPPDESGAEVRQLARDPALEEGPTLYGLHLARTAIAKAEQAIVVEGYTDVIGLVQAGYDNVVASMGTALTAAPAARAPQARPQRRAALRRRHGRERGGPARARARREPRHRLEGAGCAATEGLGSRGGGGERPRGGRSHARQGAERARLPRRARARSRGHRVRRSGARRPTRRSRRSCAACPRRPSATSSCASPRRASGSRRTPPRVSPRPAWRAGGPSRRSRPRRLRMDAAQRDEWLLLALALASGDAGSAMLARIPPEAFAHDELHSAHAWVRARLNQDEAPSVSDVQRLEAQLVALAARHGGPEALREVAGRVESRWIARRLEPLKEKLAAAEITPEEMSQLQELQALARSARGE